MLDHFATVLIKNKDATKMVAQAEEGMKMTEQEERLANIMINGKTNLARNMAAEFMKRLGIYGLTVICHKMYIKDVIF